MQFFILIYYLQMISDKHFLGLSSNASKIYQAMRTWVGNLPEQMHPSLLENEQLLKKKKIKSG